MIIKVLLSSLSIVLYAYLYNLTYYINPSIGFFFAGLVFPLLMIILKKYEGNKISRMVCVIALIEVVLHFIISFVCHYYIHPLYLFVTAPIIYILFSFCMYLFDKRKKGTVKSFLYWSMANLLLLFISLGMTVMIIVGFRLLNDLGYVWHKVFNEALAFLVFYYAFWRIGYMNIRSVMLPIS